MITLLSFMFRSPAAEWIVTKAVDKFNRDHGADLRIREVRILGMASIRIIGITLRPLAGDTLVKIDTAYASIGILKLFAGRLSIHDVELKNSWFRFSNEGGRNNYMFLVHRDVVKTDTSFRNSDYSITAERVLQFVFDKIPLSLSVRNFNLSYNNNGHDLFFHIGDLAIRDHYFRSYATIREDTLKQQWTIAGRIDARSRLAEFRIFSAGSDKVRIPYFQYKWQAGLSFDTLAFRFSEPEQETDRRRLNGFAYVNGLEVDHRMVAATPVIFDKLAFEYVVNIGKDYLEIDSASRITFNRIDFHPFIRYRPNPSKQITLRIEKPPFPAQDLFSSFPPGLFTNLDGIKVRGQLSWFVNFFADLSQPDSLCFETGLNRHNFSIISLGSSDLTKLNEPFTYTAWEHDQPVRTFIVGSENPNFRRLDQISQFLPLAVMTSEDGGFYQHRGFLPDAFRESMITNIKERRFARGGSTISMQLVKNVFLKRNKTLARKVEEALIVWLIENQGLCTKERMMEVYLNVIEWGPLIYGANEAARFYFNKDASKITLAEAIFMASIVPRPKWFRYSFNDDGHLRESNADFYRIVSEKMLSKGWITPADAEKLIPDVELKGVARLMLKQTLKVPADSMAIEE
jgi:hypothetical protein